MTPTSTGSHGDCPACGIAALKMQCPLCGAQPDQECEDAIGGWIIRRFQPHLARIEAAGGQR